MEVGIANPDKAQVRCGGLFSIIKTGARMAALLHARRNVALDLYVRPSFTGSPEGGTLPDKALSPSPRLGHPFSRLTPIPRARPLAKMKNRITTLSVKKCCGRHRAIVVFKSYF